MADPKQGFYKRKYGKNHAYYLNGVKLDGVTTLLGNGLPKPALINWAANATADYATDNWEELSKLSASKRNETLRKSRYEISDEAKARGTEVHNYAERLAKGEEVVVPDDLAGHVGSAVRFLDEFKIETILTETAVYHDKFNYGGTFDLLLRSELFPGRTILADWKTNRTGIYPETALQLTAYARATHYEISSNPSGEPSTVGLIEDLGITDLWAIWVRSDGYDVYPMEFSDSTWRAFGHITQVARTAANMDFAAGWKGNSITPDFGGEAA